MKTSRTAIRLLATAAATYLLAVAAATSVNATPPQPVFDMQRQHAVEKYLAAIKDGGGKAWQVPLANNCVRYENGIKTGFSGPQMKLDLFLHIQYSVIKDITITGWEYAPNGNTDVIRAYFDVHTAIAGHDVITAHVVEDFVVPTETGLITRIDATISL